MNLWQWITNRFKKKKPVVMKLCTCQQYVLPRLYSKEMKGHKIGRIQNKDGKVFQIYCNGEEV